MKTRFAEKARKAVPWLVPFLLILLFLLYLNQYSLLLLVHGFNPAGTETVYIGMNADGSELRAVVNDRGDRPNPKLAVMKKGVAGFWYIAETADTPDENGVVSISFIDAFGVRIAPGDSGFSYISHRIYCGNNAKKEIPNLTSHMPSGVIISVTQGEKRYVIHEMAQADPDLPEIMYVPELLKSLDCIE